MVVGKCTSADLKGREPKVRKQVPRTVSIYVGNLEETTASDVQKYIEEKYRDAFGEAVHITRVFPLVKRDDDEEGKRVN